ncbi:MAG TPA: FKBP-type peptidyl-prolyl cis-trans isomerase, partial [Kofleriaceae bacterium]|nr:FKBP-type peptidyl-prolyl cis-trans isomerase [Kofleriaceae bacterium]
ASEPKVHARTRVEADDPRPIPQRRIAPALPDTSDANPPGVPRLDGPIQTDRGVDYIDEVVGTGTQPEKGQHVKVHYSGWLPDGTKFDSSVDRGEPIHIRFDSGQVIKGWDIGLASMRVGGKRRLIIPSDLGYGERGARDVIPPDSTLVFDVELLEVGD